MFKGFSKGSQKREKQDDSLATKLTKLTNSGSGALTLTARGNEESKNSIHTDSRDDDSIGALEKKWTESLDNLEMFSYTNQGGYKITKKSSCQPGMMLKTLSQLKPTKGEKQLLVYYTPSMKHIAHWLNNKGKNSIELGCISWSYFKDKFPNLLIKDARKIRFHHVAFLASLSSPLVIFEQYAVMAAIPKHLAKSVLIFIPYFAVGTMERVTRYGEIATAETLSRMLSTIPLCARGPCQIVIFDIHALQNQFYFSDNILVRLETAIPLLHIAIRHKYQKLEEVAIAFPDEGAFKRFHMLFSEEDYGTTEMIICEKRRDGRIVTIKDGNPKNRDVVIVDDLVQTGGTLVNCAKACKKLGARTVSCYCTHGVFPQNSWERFAPNGKDWGLIDTFWITNSIPPVAEIVGNLKPFEVLDLAPLYWEVMKERL